MDGVPPVWSMVPGGSGGSLLGHLRGLGSPRFVASVFCVSKIFSFTGRT